MNIPPNKPTEGVEQSQLSFSDPLPIVDKFLDEVSSDSILEGYRKILLERRSPDFKPNVKYLDTINALHSLDPQASEALFCLEINKLAQPKVYGKAQRERLFLLASRYAASPNSPLTKALASNSEVFDQVLQLEGLSPTVADQLSKLRPPEEQADIADKIAKNFFSRYATYLLRKPAPPEGAAVFLRRIFKYFNAFTESKMVGQVIGAIGKLSLQASDRLVKLIAYFANLDGDLSVSGPGLPKEKYEIGAIFSDDMSFLQAYTGPLNEEERSELASLAVSLSTKFPDLAKLTEQVKVNRITELTQANIAKALEKVSRYTDTIATANEALDTARLADFEYDIDFYQYKSPATYEVIEFSKPNHRLSLNNLSQLLTYNRGWNLSRYDAPPELKQDVELLYAKFDAVKARLQNELAEHFEKAIPEIVVKAMASIAPLPTDDYEAVRVKMEELDRCLGSMDMPYYWGDKIFPNQIEKLVAALREAAKKQKKVLAEALPERQKVLKLKKLREAELAYREELIASRITFLLTKYGIAADLPLSDINVSVYTSEKDELIYDHVFNRDSTGQKSDLNYEIGQDPEFMKLKENAIDLIIPHEIGHLIIQETKQCELFLGKKSSQLKAAQKNLDEQQKTSVRHNLTECIVDGVGFGLSLSYGGTNTHPGQSAEILIELSKAFANLEKVLELQGNRDSLSKLMNRLRMSANIDFLLDEAEKFQVAEELTSGFQQGKIKYVETINQSNQELPKPLSDEQLNDLKKLMRQAIEFGRKIKHTPNFSED